MSNDYSSMQKNKDLELKMSGDLKTVWTELLAILREFHKSVSKITGEEKADLFLDSLAFLGNLSDEELEGDKGSALFDEFLSKINL